MRNYQKLYHLMFNAATDALRALDTQDPYVAHAILVRAQLQAEELYVTGGDRALSRS